MTVQSINNSNMIPTIVSTNSLSNISNGSAFRVYDAEEKAPTKVKVGVGLTTLASVGTAYALILRHKGCLKNPFKTPIKEWGIFNIKYRKEEEEAEKAVKNIAKKANLSFIEKLKNIVHTHNVETAVSILALSSVGGGLLGGALFDKKENMNAKYRESVIQLLGNVFTPLACVSLGMSGFKKIEPKVLDILKLTEKTDKIKGIPGVIASGLCLVSGIFLGNKVGNSLNEKCFRIKDNRKLKLSDMSPHIDDLCLATSLVAAKSSIGDYVSRIIPVALLVPGLTVGTIQEKPIIKEVHKQRAETKARQKAMEKAENNK